MEEFLEVLGTFAVVFGIGSLVGIALFILGGFGLYEMAKRIGIKNPWISFVPIFQCYILGKIAERYIRKDGKKSGKFGATLLGLNIAQYLGLIAFGVSLFYAVFDIIANVETAITADAQLSLSMFSSFIPVIAIYFILLAIAIVNSVFYYIALWRVYAIYNNSNATVYLVLSILFSFIPPIILFMIRKNIPAFDYKSRLGYFELEKV